MKFYALIKQCNGKNLPLFHCKGQKLSWYLPGLVQRNTKISTQKRIEKKDKAVKFPRKQADN